MFASLTSKDFDTLITSKISVNNTFEIKDLFNSKDWESEPAGARKSIGKQFKKWVETNDITCAIWDSFTTDRHDLYKRIN